MEDGLGGYSIEVNPVEAMDEGEWKCVATSAEDMKQFTTCHVAMSSKWKNYLFLIGFIIYLNLFEYYKFYYHLIKNF